jgi:acetyl esterase
MDDAGDHAAPYRPAGPLDPIAAQIAQAFSLTALLSLSIDQARGIVRDAAAPTREPAMAMVTNHAIPVARGIIALRVYRPVEQPAAVLVWAHGGGFALGSIEEIENFARALAARTGCAVASVAYRLAPEHKFPTAIEDLEAAVRWVAANAGDVAVPGAPLWVGGDSAGGNLATVVTRRLHAGGGPRIAGNILAYPCTLGPDAASLDDFVPPFMKAVDVRQFFAMYLPDEDAARDPDFAPMLVDDLSGLPPTLVVTAEHDILTPQAEAYAERLRASGVTVRTFRVPGMIHGFLTLDPFLAGPGGDTIGTIADFIAEHRS